MNVPIPIAPTLDGYRTFLKCKTLPHYKVVKDTVWTDDVSYAAVFDGAMESDISGAAAGYLYDYQRWVVDTALAKRRYAAFLDCGLGKTAIEVAWAHAVAEKHGKVLFLCPLAVMEDIQRFCEKFHGYRMSNLRNGGKWTTDIAIMNWESMRDFSGDTFAGVVLDESSILKNGQGKTRKWLTELVKRSTYRLAASATPSPNEQAEYATHAVWLGMATTLNEFYGRFFRKDGTKWLMKGHAVEAFYRNLRSWACYIQKPSVLGFSPIAEMPTPPQYMEIDTHAPSTLDHGELFTTGVSLTDARKVFGMRADKSTSRFRDSCDAVAGKRSLIWCTRNAEEQAFHRELGGHLVTGATPVEERVEKIDDFRAGRVMHLTSKPKVLGFGVNMPEASDMLYSGYTWSFEQFYQAVRRAHRYGRTGQLSVHVPLTDEERPIWATLRGKMRTFDADVSRLQSMMARR